MFPTLARFSKASRAPLTPKRGNKDFYKGTRQAFLPGGRRTGAPGQHVIGGKAKYRLEDEKVRVYVAPPVESIENSPLKPYVALGTRLSEFEEVAVFGKFRNSQGLSPRHFLRIARQQTHAQRHPSAPIIPSGDVEVQPIWMKAQRKLGLMPLTPPDKSSLNAVVPSVAKSPIYQPVETGLLGGPKIQELEEVPPQKP